MIKNIIILITLLIFGPWVIGALLSIGQGFGIVPLSATKLLSILLDYSIPHMMVDYYHNYTIRQGYMSLAGSV